MPEPARFILMHTSRPGNAGAAARAMKVMGFDDLVLVAPRDPRIAADAEAIAFASGAAGVLARSRVVAALGDALGGVTCVCATAMTPRDFGPPTHAPRELLPALAARGESVAFLFGGERHGLANADVYRCDAVLSIPTDPGYGSLNLAQAVQIVAYEWRLALGGFGVAAREPARKRADARSVQQLLEHWRAALEHVGFLDPKAPKKLAARLNRLACRARLTDEEVQILRGIARAMLDR